MGCQYAAMATKNIKSKKTTKPKKPRPKKNKFAGLDDLVRRVQCLERQLGLSDAEVFA
jgi:hypothetical protein